MSDQHILDSNELFEELHALLNAEDVRKQLKAALIKAAAKPRDFVGFPELIFKDGWCAPAVEQRLPAAVPGTADDERYTELTLCDHVYGVVSVGDATVRMRTSLQHRYQISAGRRVVKHAFCPECGEKIFLAAAGNSAIVI